MDVTIFSAAGCGGCVSSKYAMKSKGIEFHEVRVDQNPAAMEHFKAAGLTSVPVILAHRTDDDEVPDVILGFHSDITKWLLDPSLEIPDYLTLG